LLRSARVRRTPGRVRRVKTTTSRERPDVGELGDLGATFVGWRR